MFRKKSRLAKLNLSDDLVFKFIIEIKSHYL